MALHPQPSHCPFYCCCHDYDLMVTDHTTQGTAEGYDTVLRGPPMPAGAHEHCQSTESDNERRWCFYGSVGGVFVVTPISRWQIS